MKENGKLVICDVFQGSSLAKHFDKVVAKYCCTGHDVEFLSDDSAKKYIIGAGFKKFELTDLDIKWKFKEKKDIGKFIYNLHALTKLNTGSIEKDYVKVVAGCENILGINQVNEMYELNWPMKVLVAEK